MSIAFNAGQAGVNVTQHQMLAIGDTTGILHVMEIPRNLRRPMQAEQKIIKGFFEAMEACLSDVHARKVRDRQTIARDGRLCLSHV